MVSFLIHRPIAVTMAFIAILLVGILATFSIPVSLMPDIDVPEITVQVNRKNISARELENTVVGPLRRHLVQVAHLADISSETRDEKSTIRLRFEYGTDINFTFIEVNEKVDRAMNDFPREIQRPKVVKASATDIPVFYLNLTLKEQPQTNEVQKLSASSAPAQPQQPASNHLFPVSQKFVELSNFASQVIRKRLEQLPDVALVDMSGTVAAELLIIPDLEKLEALHISLEQLEHFIQQNNLNLGNLLIQDGQYQYNIRFNSVLSTKRDIENVYFKVENRLLQLKEVAEVIEHPQKRKGLVTSDGQDAITMAIIQQSDAQMSDLEAHLSELMNHFQTDYPTLTFTVTRDQTKLLRYSISNLNQDLFWGGLLAFLIMFFFLKDYKSPLLIGITLPASVIISLLFFYLLGISVNIISLSGLVLGVGMMIDNSIIVIDNIVQHRKMGKSLAEACSSGANEVFIPMLSSVFTTCAVFIPLIYVSGMAGALFYDEAMSVVIGAFVSLAISVTIIPVYYRLFYLKEKAGGSVNWLQRMNTLNYEALYEKSFKYVMRHQKLTWTIILLMIPVGIALYWDLPKSKLPPITQEEMLVQIDWNEKITIEENNRRIVRVLNEIKNHLSQTTCWVGEQQFLLNNSNLGATEALVYLKVSNPEELNNLQNSIGDFLDRNYPDVAFQFKEADNIFNFIFSKEEAPLTARLRPTKDIGAKRNIFLQHTLTDIQRNLPAISIPTAALQEHIVLKADPLKMMAYDISFETLYGKLKSAFNAREVFLITDGQDFIPVILGDKSRLIHEILLNASVTNKDGKIYPIREFISEAKDYDLKTITAGQEGEYYPVEMKVGENEIDGVMAKVQAAIKNANLFEVDFTGSIFSNKKLVTELSVILLISLALLYFILAAQFESLTLPLIVLIEIPIDILAAFAFLKIFNAGINVMSLIGIVVMGGIIINDSILKIDTINQLMKEGNSLLKAMMLGGQRRLKPILMTSLTTILAMVPMLLTPGLGSELQKPLAVALMGGMTVGTLISLYFIPLCYYYLKKGKSLAR